MWFLKKIYYRTYQFLMSLVLYFTPLLAPAPKIIDGKNSIKKLAEAIKKKGFKSVLVVTDPGILNLHLADTLFEALKALGISYGLYDETLPNPTIDNIEAALKVYYDNNCQAIIAVGGGSPIDCAKATGARIARPNRPVAKMRGLFKVMLPAAKMGSIRPPVLFAVPTTAGTGSETTLAAVITNSKTHEKFPITDPFVRPKYAVLDPMLTVSLPPKITAITGMDALTHAVESYCNILYNSRDTRKKAVMATSMIFKFLEKAYKDGNDIEARGKMLLAAHYAGYSFTRGGVGYVHGIGHNLGGMYNIPHGLAMTVIMPYVLEAYGEVVHRPLSELAEVAGIAKPGMTPAQEAQAFIQAIKDLNKRMDIPDKLDCIKDADIPTIAERALRECNPTYPVPVIMNKEEIMGIIRRVKG